MTETASGVPAATGRGRQRTWLLLGLFAVALNLRPALTSVGPLLSDIREALSLSASAAGLLTTAPVLCLGVFGPLAPWLSRRIGSERTTGLFLLVLAAGCLVRAVGGPGALFTGTVLAGAGIGVIGILLPALLKRDFPQHAAALTGVYTFLLCLGAALAAGLTAPVAEQADSGWRLGLGLWALPALLAFGLWLPQLRRRQETGVDAGRETPIWRDRVAWQVTLFMGLQSALAYCVFGWLPFILQTRGISVLESGFILSMSICAQFLTALGGPFVATAFRDQRPAVLLFMGLTLAGLLGLLLAPLSLRMPLALLLGLGLGGTFSVALSLIVLRARDARMAGRLSGMSQSVGYTLAASGPFLVGILYDWRGDWQAVKILFTVITVAGTLAGLGAGRRRYVGEKGVSNPDR